jgi:hypothetical protein
MKAIYCCASLTIAAAAGLHADHGLPGVGIPRGHKQYTEKIDGLTYSTMAPSYTQLHNSDSLPWNTRGWTFQEKLLSRRILFFTEYQVYFQCAEAIWTEEINMETGKLSKSVEGRKGKYSWQATQRMLIPSEKAKQMRWYNSRLRIEDDWGYLRDFVNYTTAIQEYTRRTLTDSKDMLFAVAGVLDTMKTFAGEFLQGLQERHMLESLQWYPQPGTLHRYEMADNMPSWTWASCVFSHGGVNFELMDVRELRGIVLASKEFFREFYDLEQAPAKRFGSGKVRRLSLRGIFVNLFDCLVWPILQKDHTITQMFVSDGVNIRAIRFNLPISAFNLQEFQKRQSLQKFVETTERFAKKGKCDWVPSSKHLPKTKHVLIFKTVVVSFRVGRSLYNRSTRDEDEAGVFELLNGEGECVGEIITTHRFACHEKRFYDFLTMSWGFSLQHAQLEQSYVPKWTVDSQRNNESLFNQFTPDLFQAYFMLEGQLGKFAQLPRFQEILHHMPKGFKLHMEEPRRQGQLSGLFSDLRAARSGQPRPRSLWPIVNLMMVHWEKDSGIAKRIGVGRVIMKAWQEAWNPRTEVWLA